MDGCATLPLVSSEIALGCDSPGSDGAVRIVGEGIAVRIVG